KLRTTTSGSMHKLVAATYGRGVWETDLAHPPDFVLQLDKNDIYGPLPNQVTGRLIALNGYSDTVTMSCAAVDSTAYVPSSCALKVTPTSSGQSFSIPITNAPSSPDQTDLSFFVIAKDSTGLTRQVPATMHIRDFGLNAQSFISAGSGQSAASDDISIYPIGPVTDTVQLSCLTQQSIACYLASSGVTVRPNQSTATTAYLSFSSNLPDGHYPVTIQAYSPLLRVTHSINLTLVINGFDMSANPPLRVSALPGQNIIFSGDLIPHLTYNISSITVSCVKATSSLTTCVACSYSI